MVQGQGLEMRGQRQGLVNWSFTINDKDFLEDNITVKNGEGLTVRGQEQGSSRVGFNVPPNTL